MSVLLSARHWRIFLGGFVVVLTFVAFWPSPLDEPVQGQLSAVLNFLHRHGAPQWLNYQFVEAAANVLLFLPIGFAGSLSFPEKRWWHLGILGFEISGCMELGQLIFLHNRFATSVDLLTNTSGAVIGALLAGAVTRALATRKEQVRRLPAADL